MPPAHGPGFTFHEDEHVVPETPVHYGAHGGDHAGSNPGRDATDNYGDFEVDSVPRVLRSRASGRPVLGTVPGCVVGSGNGATPRTAIKSPTQGQGVMRKASLAATEVFKDASWQAYFKSPISASRINFHAASPAARTDVFSPAEPSTPPTAENLNPKALEGGTLFRHSTDDAEDNRALHEDLRDAPDAVLAGGVYRKFLDGDAAAFFILNPKAVQAIYGRDCYDRLHPNLAMWTEHPVKTLLFPGTGQVYYIRTECHISPCVKNLPSKYAWKQRGAVEALVVQRSIPTANKDGPYICYTQYECNASVKKESEKALFHLRVYTLHSSRCPCRACHSRWCPVGLKGGVSCECGWEKKNAVYDPDNGFYALVQVLDAEAAMMKNKRAGTTPASTPVRGGGGTPVGTPRKTPTQQVLGAGAAGTAGTPRGAGTPAQRAGFALPPPPLTPVHGIKTPGKTSGGSATKKTSHTPGGARACAGGGSGKKPPPARWATTNTKQIAAALKPKTPAQGQAGALGGGMPPITPSQIDFCVGRGEASPSPRGGASGKRRGKSKSPGGGGAKGGRGEEGGGLHRQKEVAVNLVGRFVTGSGSEMGLRTDVQHAGGAYAMGHAEGVHQQQSHAGHGDVLWRDGGTLVEGPQAEFAIEWDVRGGASHGSRRSSVEGTAAQHSHILPPDAIEIAQTAVSDDLYGDMGLEWGPPQPGSPALRAREGGRLSLGESVGDRLSLGGAGRMSLSEDAALAMSHSMGAGRLSLGVGEDSASGYFVPALYGAGDDELCLDDGEEEEARGLFRAHSSEDARAPKRPKRSP